MAGKNLYRYPLTSFTDTTDYLQINIVDYVPIGKAGTVTETKTQVTGKDADGNPKIEEGRGFQLKGTSLTGTPGARRNTKKPRETILLPIPSNISDTNASSFGDSRLNSIAGAAAAGVINTIGTGEDFINAEGGVDITGGLQSFQNAVGNAFSNATTAAGGLSGVQGFVSRFFASAALSQINVNLTADQILARTTGEILNPNLELLFNGPTLRTFRFSFKFNPRSEEESREVKGIIRCLKINSAPKVQGASIKNTFLKTPSVFELTYKQGTAPHQFLNRFKQCFLESVSVNYTGSNGYATYDDGTPVSMIMTLTFKEIEPIYDIDYNPYSGPYAPGQDPATPGGVGY